MNEIAKHPCKCCLCYLAKEQRWSCDNLESCVHLPSKQEMKSCRQSCQMTWNLEVPFHSKMHESTEYFMQTQQILSAFVSGLSDCLRVYKTKRWNQGHPIRLNFLSLLTSKYLSFLS
ncbi:hypothetical protein IMY05_008G0110300 [Salix suchowensis]|nr:hypothetical protein IMY05_008G0110300 [Salix suchowensis]